jgi:hypothetical protein
VARGSSRGGETVSTDSDDPAAAFNALRQAIKKYATETQEELRSLRRGAELRLESLEEQARPIDYSADLGELSKASRDVEVRLAKLEEGGIWKVSAQEFAQALVYASEQTRARLVSQVIAAIGSDKRADDVLRSEIASALHGARERRRQNIIVAIASGIGLIAGVLLLLIVPRFLPFDASGHLAAAIIGKDRWSAGQALMQAGDPASWRNLMAVSETRNGGEIVKCQATAIKTGKSQRCVIIVAPATN